MTTLADAIAALPTSYSPAFLALINFVTPHEVEFELGHADDYDFVRTEHDPNDPGGTTRYGLDAASHPHLDIDSLTFAAAVAVYYSEIWVPLFGESLPPPVALALCDSSINCGTVRSVRWLQQIVGATPIDGAMGKETASAVNQHGDPVGTAKALDERRDYYYRNEVRESLRDEYLIGWENRVADLDGAIDIFASQDSASSIAAANSAQAANATPASAT